MNRYHLFEICEINPKKDIPLDNSSSVTFLPMEAVSTDGTIDTSRTIPVEQVKNYSAFKDNDILFAKITPCMENGKGAIVSNLKNGYGAGSTEFIVLRPKDMVSSKWLYYFLSQKNFRMHCQQHMTGSAGQKRVPAKFLANCEIGVPTLEEQERIVARIEELFSQLDSGVETLKKTKEQLAVYRQAVLSDLYPVMTKENTVRLDNIAQITGGITKGRDLACYDTIELPYLRVANVQDGFLDLSEMKTIELKIDEKEKYLLAAGDVLYTEGGDRDKLGRGTVWNDEIPNCVHQNHVFKARIDKGRALPQYVAYWSMSRYARNYFYSHARQSVNLASINKSILSALLLPLPDIAVQADIVDIIDTKMSICADIEKTIDVAIQQAEAMRQSILKKAFEGEV